MLYLVLLIYINKVNQLSALVREEKNTHIYISSLI
jgi:hypothetical protein